MDTTLYIVAGLIVFLLIAVLLQRRQKAQRPPARSIDRDKRAGTARSASIENEPNLGIDTSATRFDDVAVAQRFIDQQRYDKAVETLNRGLTTKPNDSNLLLKLLSVYSLTNQNEAFKNTYATIVTQGNPETIAQASHLRSLLDNEPLEMTNASISNDTSSADSNYDSLDFNLLGKQNDSESYPVKTNTLKSDDISTNNVINEPLDHLDSLDNFDNVKPTDDVEPADGIFDLTLDDLESSEIDADSSIDNELSIQNTTSNNPVTPDNINATSPAQDTDYSSNNLDEDFSFLLDETDSAGSAQDTSVAGNSNESLDRPLYNTNEDNDFTLDFADLTVDKNESSISPFSKVPADNDSLEFDLSASESDTFKLDTSDDFTVDNSNVLDDDDLSNATDNSSVNLPSSDLEEFEAKLDDHSSFSTGSSNTDNFDIDSLSNSNSNSNSNSITVSDERSIDTLDFDISNDFVLDDSISDSSVADDFTDVDTIQSDTSQNIFKSSSLKSSNKPDQLDSDATTDSSALRFDDNTMLFDDDTVLNEDFDIVADRDIESASTTMPVLEDKPSPDFKAQFSKDFGFVTDLDSSQVTLDLATKYLELGEYDSAKRLLSEVMAQGNHDQQAKAQNLLARTA